MSRVSFGGRFPWLQKLEENAAVVQEELKEVCEMDWMYCMLCA